MKPILKALAVALPLAGVATTASAALRPASDFDGDGRSDVGWHNWTSYANTVWLAANSGARLSMPTLDSNWNIAGSGDLDGDGRADLVWRHSITLANVVWKSGNSSTRCRARSLTTGLHSTSPAIRVVV